MLMWTIEHVTYLPLGENFYLWFWVVSSHIFHVLYLSYQAWFSKDLYTQCMWVGPIHQLSLVPISRYKCLTHMGWIEEDLCYCEIWHYCVSILPYNRTHTRKQNIDYSNVFLLLFTHWSTRIAFDFLWSWWTLKGMLTENHLNHM